MCLLAYESAVWAGFKRAHLCTTVHLPGQPGDGGGVRWVLESTEGPFPRISYGWCWQLLGPQSVSISSLHVGQFGLLHSMVTAFKGSVLWARGPSGRVSPFIVMWQSSGIISAAFSWLKQSGILLRFKGRGGKESDSCWRRVEFWKFTAVTILENTACFRLKIQLPETRPLWILALSFSDSSKPAERVGCSIFSVVNDGSQSTVLSSCSSNRYLGF